MKYWTRMDSPVGGLLLVGDDAALHAIRFVAGPKSSAPPEGATERHMSFRNVIRQLEEYFAGERRRFDLPLAPQGTSFQRAVWDALLEIEYGRTASYGDIARMIGNPNAVRAVGLANGRNPLPIVIPCHRVIGSNGTLTGYGGGLPVKKRLLEIEGAPYRREPHDRSLELELNPGP